VDHVLIVDVETLEVVKILMMDLVFAQILFILEPFATTDKISQPPLLLDSLRLGL